MEGSTALARRDGGQVALGEPAYMQYDQSKIQLIKSTVMPPEATDGDLYMLLELSARYGLDPFLRQIWAAKMKGAQGEKGGVAILVGRDGILSIASRRDDYGGFESGVVHENDEFSADLSAGKDPEVIHKQAHPKERGDILGAWCIAYREGRKPRYFFAPYDEYVPRSEGKLRYSPWGTMKTVMIEKCAISTAHRLQFSIHGLYEPDEMANAIAMEGTGAKGGAPNVFDYGDDPVLGLHIADLFDAAEQARPGSFLPARQKAMLHERNTPEKREGLVRELVEYIEQHGGEVPARPTAEEAAVIENAQRAATPGGGDEEEIEEGEVEEEEQEVEPPEEQQTLA